MCISEPDCVEFTVDDIISSIHDRHSQTLYLPTETQGCLQTLPPAGTSPLGLPQGKGPFLHLFSVPQTKGKCPHFLLGQSKASAEYQGAPWGGPRCRSCSCPWLDLQLSCHLTPVLLADRRPCPPRWHFVWLHFRAVSPFSLLLRSLSKIETGPGVYHPGESKAPRS